MPVVELNCWSRLIVWRCFDTRSSWMGKANIDSKISRNTNFSEALYSTNMISLWIESRALELRPENLRMLISHHPEKFLPFSTTIMLPRHDQTGQVSTHSSDPKKFRMLQSIPDRYYSLGHNSPPQLSAVWDNFATRAFCTSKMPIAQRTKTHPSGT